MIKKLRGIGQSVLCGLFVVLAMSAAAAAQGVPGQPAANQPAANQPA
jgi:hypothetical protein